ALRRESWDLRGGAQPAAGCRLRHLPGGARTPRVAGYHTARHRRRPGEWHRAHRRADRGTAQRGAPGNREAAVAEAAAPYGGDDGFAVPIVAILAYGVKPGA